MIVNNNSIIKYLFMGIYLYNLTYTLQSKGENILREDITPIAKA
jgi:hypothetical protein